MGDKITKSPHIRFAGFTDAWEERKLGEAVKFYNGRAYKQTELQESGKYRVLRVGNFNTNDKWYYSDLELEDNKYAEKGDLLYLWSTNFGPELWKEERVIYHYHIWKLEIEDENLDKQYLYTWLETDKERIKQNTNGSTMVHVTKGYMEERGFQFPENIKEQIKIGEYFNNLDNLITLHQRKLELLKVTKKSMLQKMFPKDGESVPEIRFAGFTDAWEECELGDLSESFEYGLNATAMEFDGKNKYIRITDIDDESREFLNKGLTSPNVDLSRAENFKLQNGDIVFARTGASVGKSYIYKDSDGLVYYAGFLIRARIKPQYSAEFIFQNTLTTEYNKFIRITSQRSGQPGVNAQEYSEFALKIPKFEEQTKIGTFFRNIDNLITFHQRELDLLKELKKSMLKQMFI